LDEPTFEISRGDEAENNILPTVSATIEEVPTHKYSTRSSARGSRMRWDPNTHQLIGATEDVMAIHRTKKSKIFNISVKAAMKSMPEAAISSMYKELHQLLRKGVFIGIQPNFKHNKKVIKSFLFLKEKFKPDGSFDKVKTSRWRPYAEQRRNSI
jgi:hypothetical protein